MDVFDAMNEEKGESDPMQSAMAGMMVVQALQATVGPLTLAIQQATKASERDATQDTRVAQLMESLDTRLSTLETAVVNLTRCLDGFNETLRTPETRTGVVELPTGQVKMTVTHKRGH